MPSVESRGGSIRVKWWGGQYKTGPDGQPTKQKKYESASGPEPGVKFKDEREAEDYGLDRESDVRNKRHRPRNNDPMGMEEYCDVWFASVNLRVQSNVTYRSILKSVIKPYWVEWAVEEITPIEYAAFAEHVAAKYSENYRKSVLGLFRMLMDDAVIRYKIREESPVVEQRRRGKYTKAKTQPVKRPLSIQSVHQAARNAHTVWGYAGWVYIWTIAFTAMRPPGETYGLQRGYCSPCWPESEPDKDLRKEGIKRYGKMPAIRVEYQTYMAESRPVLAVPKYESSRTLVIPAFLDEMHRALLASHNSPWLFLSMSGKPLLGTSFRRNYWYPIRDGAKAKTPRDKRWARPVVEPVEELAGERIYRLRHWHKALLDEPGALIPRVAIEARMGHELPGVEGTYSEVTLAMEARIVEYLQEVWEKQVLGAGLWVPPFPIRVPDDLSNGAPPLFSGLPVLE